MIHFEDLKPLIEIAHADPYVPFLSLATVKGMELPDDMERRIFIFERGSQFELLTTNPETFMRVSPVPKTVLRRYDLIQRDCPDNRKIYRDVLIDRKNYALSELDRRFIRELTLSQQRHF